MVYFRTQNPNLGKFRRELEWKMLVYFMTIWNILRPFGIFYDHLQYFIAIWYILWPFGIVCGLLVYFSQLFLFGSRKIWQP
jgi:hypothetical protein